MSADHAPSEMEEAVEAARRIVKRYRHYPVVRNSEANYDTPISDSNIVARAFLALSRKAEEWKAEERERCAKAVENMRPCPFKKNSPPHDLEPTDPCPVCGDLGTALAADYPSKCQSPAAIIRSLPALIEEGE